jgi:RNA polymerase sigma-70 factor (ECF subfamily)
MTREELSKSVLEHRETVFRIVLGYVKNVHDSEDITQNVFMKLYVHDKDFISKEAEKSWLIRVAINEAKDLLKSAWNRNKSNIEELDESLVAPSHENHFEIYEYVKNLKPKYRTVIYMHYYG